MRKRLEDLNDDCLILLLNALSGGRLKELLPLRTVCRRWNVAVARITARKRSAKLFLAFRWSPYKQLVDYVRYLEEFSLLGDGRLKLQGAATSAKEAEPDHPCSEKGNDDCDDMIVKGCGAYLETEVFFFLRRLLPNLQHLVVYVQLDSSPVDLPYLLSQWAGSLTSLSLIGVMPSKQPILRALFATIFSMQKLERLDYLLDEVSEPFSSRRNRFSSSFMPDFLKDTIYEMDWFMIASKDEDNEEDDDNNVSFTAPAKVIGPKRLEDFKADILEMGGKSYCLPALKHFSTTRATDIDGRLATMKAVLGLDARNKENKVRSQITTVAVLLNRQHRLKTTTSWDRNYTTAAYHAREQLIGSPGRTFPLADRLGVTGVLALQAHLTSLTLQWPLNIGDLRYISTVFSRLESISFSICFTEMPISLERLLLALQPLRRLTTLHIDGCNLLHICHSFKSEQQQPNSSSKKEYLSPFSSLQPLHHRQRLATVQKLSIVFAPGYPTRATTSSGNGLLSILWELLAFSFPNVKTVRLFNMPGELAQAVKHGPLIEEHFGWRVGCGSSTSNASDALPTLFLGPEENDDIATKNVSVTGRSRSAVVESELSSEASERLYHFGVHQPIISEVRGRKAAREEQLGPYFKKLSLRHGFNCKKVGAAVGGEWSNVFPLE